jgi:hypothetical protein
MQSSLIRIKFLIFRNLRSKTSPFLYLFLLFSIPVVQAQTENKGWHFLTWGMSENEVEKAVDQYTKGNSKVFQKQSALNEKPSLNFSFEGTEVSCFFEKGLTQVKEIQHFDYPDSTQAAVAFDAFYYSLAEKLGETITIHDKRAQCKIMSWKFNFTRIKVLFYYSSILGTKNKANHLELEMTYWQE